MSKTKHNPPREAKPKFIEFSKVQKSYLNEVMIRQKTELNDALKSVYDEVGITQKILVAPPGTYQLRKDRSGLDVVPQAVIKLSLKKDEK